MHGRNWMIHGIHYELRGLLTGAAVLAAVALWLASVDLNLPAQDVLHSLRFHLGAATLMLPLALFLAGARWRAAIMTLLIVASLWHGLSIIQAQQSLRQDANDNGSSFSILSFNVLANGEQGQNVADYMIAVAPEIAVIMETPGIERALERLKRVYPYRIGCDHSETCDLAVFSKNPITTAKLYPFGPLQRERLIVATVNISGRDVTVLALHLSKPYFDGASEAELWQASSVLKTIEGPVLVAGDFNDAPWSTSIERFVRRNGLIPGPSYPATWPVRLGSFGIPIDIILTRGGMQIEDIAATPENFGSNHFGLLARVQFIETPSPT